MLWRVLLAVGVLFGGAGLAAYLIGWLAMPEEGDSGSPLEALFGRGHSRTSPAVTVVLAVAVGALLAITVEWSPVFIVVVAALGYVIYRQRRQQPLWPHRHSPPQPPGGQAAPPYGSPAGPPPTWHAGPPPTWHPAPPATPPTPPGGPPGPPEGPPAAAAAEPTGEAPDVPAAESNAPTTASPAATDERPTQNLSAGADSEDRMAMEPTESQLTGEADQAARDEETAVLAAAARYERDTVPIEPIWPERRFDAPPEPAQAKLPRERSVLGRVAFFAVLMSIGLMGALDLAGLTIGFSGYVAGALSVIGLALLAGAWIGRARWLVWVGALLSVLLAISTVVGAAGERGAGQRKIWTHTSVEQIQDSYQLTFSDGVLDLSGVDFSGHTGPIKLQLEGSNMVVNLPPDVDVAGDADVRYSNVVLVDGTGRPTQVGGAFSDLGADSAQGPGQLEFDIEMQASNLELRR